MELDPKAEKLILVVVFALMFAGLSWIIPVAYHSASPAENYVEITDSELQIEDNTTHQLNLTYKSRGRYPVEATVSLYEEGEPVSVGSWQMSGFIPQGSHVADLSLDRSEPLTPGTYYYSVDVRIHLEKDVLKTYYWESPRFVVSNETATNETSMVES